jgi:hypothetical protein
MIVRDPTPSRSPSPFFSATAPALEAGFFYSEDAMTTTFRRNRRDVPKRAWRWPNSSPAEIAGRGTGKLFVNEPAIDKLQALRDRLVSAFENFGRQLDHARIQHSHPL